ncbi:MAG TPA: EAL domain-containing protein [Pseudonocardia sp.]|nr:EAL domain-containing protein [Pseudonocardia sp.]
MGEACYLAWGTPEAIASLSPLSAQLAELLKADQPDPTSARRLGAQLAEARFRGPDALQVSLRLIRTRAPELFEVHDAAERIGELIGELAAGYADALRERTQVEQELLLSAVLQTRREAEAALRDSEQRFRAIFTEAGVGIALVGLDGHVLDVNPALYRLFNVSESMAGPRPLTDHVHPEDAPAMIADFRELTTGRRDNMHGEVRFVRLDGTVIWTYVTASLVRDAAGAPDYVIGVVEDVTERHQLRSRLRHQTYHDQLTRLPNRALMNEQLRWAFSDDSTVTRVGLCHLDLDGFRAINDSLGHQVGDQLLLAVAGRLQLLGGGHLVTRTGGDEFAILVTDPPSVNYLSELAGHLLAGLIPPFVIGSQLLSITASLGIAESAVTNTWPGELQRAADAARSWAKGAGGGRWAVFDAERDAGETTRFALAASVPGAVDRDEFHLFYQPLVELATGDLTGVEALVRWRHPEHGLLGPARFIELAERNGAIVPLGRWVLTEACRQARRWADELGRGAPYVSVNVAPRQLAEPGWLTEVSTVLADTGLDPGQLQLEITERAVLVDETAASDTLRTLREMGVRLAIDDFGTGYSSLSYLRRLPVHGLKIDGSFIRGLRETGPELDRGPAADLAPDLTGGLPPGLELGADPEDTPDSKIVAALISMAHALDLVVTAEWVETAAQARKLRALGCDVGQGHWYGDPVPASQLAPLLRRPLAG